mmetsp:Transcript_8346/g.11910  ORF Transcript_8346/g.11910 Transcript_8346/m.11910 type:complete len:159 (-) Transcript_8346:131-607(-)
MLSEFYTSCCVPNKVEIVYISSDRDIPSFNEYFGKMNFTAIPFTSESTPIKQKLSGLLKIAGYPTLVVLNSKGHFVTEDARFEVSAVHNDKSKGNALIESWKKKDAVPISDAKLGKSMISTLISYVLKNPMLLVGLYFLIKKVMKRLADLGNEHEEEL